MTSAPIVDAKSYKHALCHYQSENKRLCLAWIDTAMCPLIMMHLNCPFLHDYPLNMSKKSIEKHRRLVSKKKELFKNVDKEYSM